MRVASLLPLVALLVAPADARRCKARTDRYPAAPTPKPSGAGDSLFQQPGQDKDHHGGDGKGHGDGNGHHNDQGHHNGWNNDGNGHHNQQPSPESATTSSTTTAAPGPTDSAEKDDQQQDGQGEQQGDKSTSSDTPAESPTDKETPAETPTPSPTDDSSTSASPTSTENSQPTDAVNPTDANPQGGVSQDDPLAAKLLEIHNGWRSYYGVPPVTWSTEMSQRAVELSNDCTTDNAFPGQESRWTDVIWPAADGAMAKEVDATGGDGLAGKYNYDQPGFQQPASQWIQMVWRATTEIGCGWHKCDTWSNAPGNDGLNKLVCLYNTHNTYQSPVEGQPNPFEENIPRAP